MLELCIVHIPRVCVPGMENDQLEGGNAVCAKNSPKEPVKCDGRIMSTLYWLKTLSAACC